MKNFFLVIILFLAILCPRTTLFGAGSPAGRLAGRILLQVESHGQAWYINPDNLMRYYLGRPADAWRLMREQGVGITNEDLAKIAVGLVAGDEFKNSDADNDGLADALEDAIGTDKTKADTDVDGHNDRDELVGGYNPLGAGVWPVDINFTKRNAGKIFLQVEAAGEAWYVSPADGKRYFLGRPEDAFNIMRGLGLGISDSDLKKILIMVPDYNLPALERLIQKLVNDERVSRGLAAVAWNSELAAVARRHSRNLAGENKALTGLESSCDYPLIHHEDLNGGAYNLNRLQNRGIYYFSRTGENIALISGIKNKYVRTTTAVAGEMQKKLDECESRERDWDERFKDALEKEKDEGVKLQIVRDEINRRRQAFGREDAIIIADISWKTREQLAADTVRGWMNSPGHRENILTAEYGEAGLGAAYVNGYLIATQVFIKRAECGFQNGPCCEKEGYYPYCFVPLECGGGICRP